MRPLRFMAPGRGPLDCYVADLIGGPLRFVDTGDSLTRPVSPGNSRELTILGLTDTVIEMTKMRAQITRLPPLADDPRQRRQDTSLPSAELKWQDATPLAEGLRPTKKYFDWLLVEGYGAGTSNRHAN